MVICCQYQEMSSLSCDCNQISATKMKRARYEGWLDNVIGKLLLAESSARTVTWGSQLISSWPSPQSHLGFLKTSWTTSKAEYPERMLPEGPAETSKFLYSSVSEIPVINSRCIPFTRRSLNLAQTRGREIRLHNFLNGRSRKCCVAIFKSIQEIWVPTTTPSFC